MSELRARSLLPFLRLAAEAERLDDVLSALCDLFVAELGAEAVVALRVTEDGRLAISAMRNAPASLKDWSDDATCAVTEELLTAAGPPFVHADALSLIADGNLYGFVVPLATAQEHLSPDRLDLARALTDLAALVIGRAVQLGRLERAYRELRDSRALLARTEKLRSLGLMAAGIAHDLKNILSPLVLQVELMRRHLKQGTPISDETLARMKRVLDTGNDTVERIRGFSRQDVEAAPEPTDLAVCAKAAVDICSPRLRAVPGLAVKLEPAPAPQVRVRASELVTALVNLLVNAADALTSAARPGGSSIAVTTGAADGGGFVEVADDGPGMSPEVEKRVFEPFFTTKGKQGTGLGLAMVYAFVQRHRGQILLDTAIGRGTTLRMWFPAATSAAAPVPAGRPRRVLVVEDDPAALKALCLLLEGDGFHCAGAANGDEALALLAAFSPEALVVDRFLPGVDAAALIEKARASAAAAERPLPLVIISGAPADEPAVAALLRQPATGYLAKPVEIDKLVALLRRLLAPEPAPASMP